MEAALYDSEAGFFGSGGGAGRAGSDFVTSPEVGALFGALVARAVDEWWDRLGRPDPFLVVDAGAGRGRLAADVLRAAPACAAALRYVLVERSPALRAAHDEHLPIEPAAEVLGPAVAADPFVAVVVANELLDNLPFRIVERAAAGGWQEIRVGNDPAGGGGFVEVVLPADESLAAEVDGLAAGTEVPAGTRLPVQTGVARWLADCARVLRRGAVIVVDYAAEVDELAERGQSGWLRTYRAHRRGSAPLDDPGTQDITADVALPALRHGAARAGFRPVAETTQADWLRSLGVDALAAEARSAWDARQSNDLPALAARSRVGEAAALLDPAGLGAHRVVILTKA